MAHRISAKYKQGTAHYQIVDMAGYRIATLLFYKGQAYNRPPARLIVVDADAQCQQLLRQPALADDVRTSLKQKGNTPAADPLFPHKSYRNCVVDQLV